MMSSASSDNHNTPSSALSNNVTKPNVSIVITTRVVHRRAEDDAVAASLQLNKSAVVKVRSLTVAETHKSSSTNSIVELKVACGQTVSVHGANAKKDTSRYKRRHREEIYINKKT